MLIVLKLTLANIRQKKFRSTLIIISIILSVALMYTILSLSNTTTDIFNQKIRKEVGSAELILTPKENSGERYIPELNFENITGISYHIPYISAYGYSEIAEEKVPIAFVGMSMKDYETIYGLEYIQNTSDFLTENQVLIGKETAEVYDLILGDNIQVTIGGKERNYKLIGIVKDQNNNLSYDLGKLELAISKDTLKEILGLDNQVNAYYLKSLPEKGKNSLKEDLIEAYPEYEVRDVADLQDYKQMISMLVTSLFLMVSAVIMVSAFIIFSSFKIIAIERMPLMGTLRSIGATRKMTVRTLLYEAFFYGFIGGILGNGLGVLILSITMKLMFHNIGITMEEISYVNINYFLIALMIGLVLSIGSAVVPILKTSKKSIRSIIFSEIDNEKHVSLIKTIVGIFLIAIAFIIFNIAPLHLQLVFDIIGMFFVTIGGAMVIPLLSTILTKILSFLFRPLYKDGFGVVTANIKYDRTMMNNIMLLAMGLGIILMINNFSSTVGSAVSDVYATGKADAMVFYTMEEDFVKQVHEVAGVEHVYTTKEAINLTANEGSVELLSLQGIDGRGYSEYGWNEFGEFLTDDLMQQFRQKRSIIISRFTARKYDLNKGDILEIEFDQTTKPYEVITIVPSVMNNGNVSFIFEDFLAEDTGVKNYQSMYLNIDDHYDIKKVMQEIKELMPQSILPIQTLEEMREQNLNENNGIFFLMKAVSIIAMFIGVVGILNNFTISFLNRRKLIATMRSLGLSRMKTISNMLFEAFLCGCLGTLSGLMLGTVLLRAMCFLVEAMGLPADVLFYNISDYMFVLISGITLSLVSAILPAISIAKENIIAGLRYE